MPATLQDVLDPGKYEALTCANAGRGKGPALGADGRPAWRWGCRQSTRTTTACGPAASTAWIANGR